MHRLLLALSMLARILDRVVGKIQTAWLLVTGLILTGCGPSTSSDPASTTVSPIIAEELLGKSTVPDPNVKSCAECHEKEYNEWVSSQHAWANYLAGQENDVGAAVPGGNGSGETPDATIKHGDYDMTVEKKGDDLTFTAEGPDGKSTHIAEAVIGIEPLRQYLVPFPGGRLQTVDTAFDPRSNEWFYAFHDEREPQDWGHWMNRSMTWNMQCAFCHMTGFQKNYDMETDTYASTWDAMGISCAQCHTGDEMLDAGCQVPMEGHAQSYSSSSSSSSSTNLSEYENEDDDKDDWGHIDNCASCHSRRERLTSNFKPGDNFHDHFRIALANREGIYYPDGQVLEEDYEYGSFLMSRMHLKGITCLDCHNPHSGKLVVEARNNALCMTCHIAPGQRNATVIDPITHSHHKTGTKGDACIDCHMPVTHYMVRDPRRDHGFTSPDPLLTKELGIPNACNRCHEDQTAEWAIEWTDTWYGEKMDRRARRRAQAVARAQEGDDSVVEELLTLVKDEEIDIWRATLISLLAPWASEEDVAAYLTTFLEDKSPMVRAAAISVLEPLTGAYDQIKPLRSDPVRLVRIDAAWATMNQLEREPNSYAEVMQYLQVLGDQPAGAVRWAQRALSEGRPDEAEQWMRKAANWDPSAPTYYLYGRVLHGIGKTDEAIEVTEKAFAIAPDDASYPFALALLYGEKGDATKPAEYLKKTVELDPAFARAWYNLGLALAQGKQFDEAVAALKKAEELIPNSPDAAYARATIHIQQGDHEAAANAAMKVLQIDPTHRNAMGLLRELQRR